MGDVTTFIQRGKSPKYGSGLTQIIKSGQLRGLHNFEFKEKFYLEDNFSIGARRLIYGDLLINSTGVGTAGRFALFQLDGDFTVDSHITIVRLDSKIINPAYVMYSLYYQYGFRGIEKMATGSSGQIELGLETIKNLQFPIPPLEIQQQIVDELNAKHQYIKLTEQLIAKQQSKMKEIVNSIWKE